MAKNRYDLLDVAHDCHSCFHLDMCSPVDLFIVHVSQDGLVLLLPNHDRHIDYFYGSTMTYIADFMNNHGVSWSVVLWYGSIAIKLIHE